MYICDGCGIRFQVIAAFSCPICEGNLIESHKLYLKEENKLEVVSLAELERIMLDFPYEAKNQLEVRKRIEVITDLVEKINDFYKTR